MSRWMDQGPLVSVIMPTYKRADMICRAVESVLNQTYPHVEVVVANDNPLESPERESTDNKLEQYVKTGRVRIVHTSGRTGGGAARNYAEKYARGQYLAFLDDDDEYLPDKIERELEFILSNDLDMAFQDVSTYKPDGTLVEYRRLNHVKDFSKEGLLRAHVIVPLCPTSVYMLKKELFDRTSGFGETITAQDWHLMRRCIEADAKIGYMPGSYVKQYLHNGERVSLGKGKIRGENDLYEWKKQYFSLLNPSERRYVKFYHYSVLGVSCFRSGMKLRAVYHFFQGFFSAPRESLIEFHKRLIVRGKGI